MRQRTDAPPGRLYRKYPHPQIPQPKIIKIRSG